MNDAPGRILPKSDQPSVIFYTNWRGEYASRSIIPEFVWYGVTPWHPTPQWFLRALDTDRSAVRDFALEDIGQPPIDPDIAAAATERAVRAALEMAARLIYAENYDDPVSAGDAIRAIRDNSKAMAKIIEGAQDAKR